MKAPPHRAQGPGVPAATPPSPPPVEKPRKKALLSVLAFLRGFSPSGGSWSRPPSLPGHRSPLSWAPCLSTPGKHCRELKNSLSAANNGATIISRGFFSLLGCPWLPRRAQRALRPGFWALGSRFRACGCFSAPASGSHAIRATCLCALRFEIVRGSQTGAMFPGYLATRHA
jgi:hypothetical protein